MFDRAAERGNPVVDFFGASLTLPPEARFSSSETVQRYVDDVLAHPAVRERWPGVSPLRVRARRGHTAAHYECTADADGRDEARAAAIIAVPERGTSWALRELVVLHELAHHLAPDDEVAHGGAFVSRLLDLVDGVVGPEAALLLRITMHDTGVRIG